MLTDNQILVVDDEEIMLKSLEAWLTDEGFLVRTAENGMDALRLIRELKPDVIVLDIKMPGMDGVTLLKKIKEVDSELPVIMITAYGTIENAVESMKEGAFDFLTKPFPPEKLSHMLKLVLEHQHLKRENIRLTKERNHILQITLSIIVSMIILGLLYYFVLAK